jgi:hypothetical protein
MAKNNPFARFLGPEDHLQIQVVKYALLQYRGIKIHHSPNEGRRTPFEQYKLKALNASPGWADLILCYKGKMIAIELKAGKNKATDYQKEWLNTFNECGIPADECNTFEKAIAFIDQHFALLKKQKQAA